MQDLTGIREADVEGAPLLANVAAEFQAFLGDSPLVGHNVTGFDVVFLQRAGIVHSPVLFDTADIASLLMPGEPEYGLSALAERLGIDVREIHRAPADAETSRRLFLALMERAAKLPTDVLSQVAEWLVPTAYPWRSFFAKAWEQASQVGGQPFRLSAPAMPQPISPVKERVMVPVERSLRALASAASRSGCAAGVGGAGGAGADDGSGGFGAGRGEAADRGGGDGDGEVAGVPDTGGGAGGGERAAGGGVDGDDQPAGAAHGEGYPGDDVPGGGSRKREGGTRKQDGSDPRWR